MNFGKLSVIKTFDLIIEVLFQAEIEAINYF